MPADNTAIAPVHTTPAPDLPGHDPRLGDDPLGDRIAALCAHIDAATYRLLTLLRVYDEEGRWQGSRSCAHWLSWRTGISLGPAREKVRVARCLPSLPRISDAFAKGEISYSKVRALTRVATAGNEAELLTFARHGTTAHVERLVREWRRLDRSDDCQAGPADPTEQRGLSLHLADDGNYEIRGQLSPEVGALLLKALEVTEDKLYREQRSAGTEHETTAAQRRADAFGLWLEEHLQPRVQLVVHSFAAADSPRGSAETSRPGVEAPSLVTEDGGRVSAETSSRLCCDAEVVPIARGKDASVLDVGRRSRTVGWRLRKALEARDGGCRFPGCGSRVRTHAHHITHWAHGGETAMDNLVLLCPFHHRSVHEGGWSVKMDEEGVPNFFNPLGVRMPMAPKAPDIGDLVPGDLVPGDLVPGDEAAARPTDPSAPATDATPSPPADAPATSPPDASARPSQDFGLGHWHGRKDIDAWTGTPLWQGERIDWSWAMVCLWGEGGDRGVGDRGEPPRADWG